MLQGPETKQGTKQGKKLDQAPFDNVMEVLSLPAVRARYFVARLLGGKLGWNNDLHVAAANGRVDVVKVLLDRGVSIGATNDRGGTALHLAAAGGHIGVVEVLLGRDASIDAMDNDMLTALHEAAKSGRGIAVGEGRKH